MTNAADGPRAALVRPPSDAFARAISSGGAAIDPDRARAQHAAYRAALADLVEVVVLPADQELPDACFVDDCAVVFGGQALLTRPGAPSRAAEPERLADVLAGLVDELHPMTAPATLDGGDVMRLGRTLVAGRSERTGQAGIAQLTRFAEAAGGRVEVAAVPRARCTSRAPSPPWPTTPSSAPPSCSSSRPCRAWPPRWSCPRKRRPPATSWPSGPR